MLQGNAILASPSIFSPLDIFSNYPTDFLGLNLKEAAHTVLDFSVLDFQNDTLPASRKT
jgi:hypothetical protein